MVELSAVFTIRYTEAPREALEAMNIAALARRSRITPYRSVTGKPGLCINANALWLNNKGVSSPFKINVSKKKINIFIYLSILYSYWFILLCI